MFYIMNVRPLALASETATLETIHEHETRPVDHGICWQIKMNDVMTRIRIHFLVAYESRRWDLSYM